MTNEKCCPSIHETNALMSIVCGSSTTAYTARTGRGASDVAKQSVTENSSSNAHAPFGCRNFERNSTSRTNSGSAASSVLGGGVGGVSPEPLAKHAGRGRMTWKGTPRPGRTSAAVEKEQTVKS